uniref:Uncharacterized protein n=1 Tax=Timema douglasi TaxID=61478 RepID=A0A7R8ZAN4_TIMDO|nr:unnamed protein product [Timema douglasi]
MDQATPSAENDRSEPTRENPTFNSSIGISNSSTSAQPLCEESSQKYMLMMDHIAPTETPQSPPEELPMPPPGKQWCEEVGGMDEYELLGRAWGSKLRRLSPPTRRQAERLVHEVFFLADMGDLSGQSRVVAGSRVKLIKLTSQCIQIALQNSSRSGNTASDVNKGIVGTVAGQVTTAEHTQEQPATPIREHIFKRCTVSAKESDRRSSCCWAWHRLKGPSNAPYTGRGIYVYHFNYLLGALGPGHDLSLHHNVPLVLRPQPPALCSLGVPTSASTTMFPWCYDLSLHHNVLWVFRPQPPSQCSLGVPTSASIPMFSGCPDLSLHPNVPSVSRPQPPSQCSLGVPTSASSTMFSGCPDLSLQHNVLQLSNNMHLSQVSPSKNRIQTSHNPHYQALKLETCRPALNRCYRMVVGVTRERIPSADPSSTAAQTGAPQGNSSSLET